MKKRIQTLATLSFGFYAIGMTSLQASVQVREPASFGFSVLAVSEEDAVEKAAEMLRDGSLQREIAWEKVVTASIPLCKERSSDFECETRLSY